MNDTQDPTSPPEGDAARGSRPADDFDARRLRTVAEMKRSSDPRLVAGVCTGIARHLGIDPILVRIVFGVLIFVGGAGLILYAGFWFLVPADDAETSIAADWFKLEGNEERIRVGGLVLVAVVALLSALGDGGWGGGGGAAWLLVPLAVLVYLFVVRPRRRRERRAAATASALQSPTHESVQDGMRTTTYTLPPEPRSWALTGLTVSVTAIAIAITRIIADSGDGTPWTTYVALSLAIVAGGLLVSTVLGDGGPLILLGLALAATLGLAAVLPTPRLGEQELAPSAAAEVASSYEHGIGVLELDLTEVTDPDALLGRTVTLQTGVGQTRVIVPNGLNVAVDAELAAGEISLFDLVTNGTETELSVPAEPGRALTLTIEHTIGDVEVIRR